MSEQQIDAVADQIRGRLVACIEQEDAVVQQLEFAQTLGFIAVRTGKLARGDERLKDRTGVIRSATPVDQSDQIVLEFVDRGHPAGKLLRAEHRFEGTEDGE